MTTLEERMRWTPGEPTPPLDLDDVLVMLGVVGEPEEVQRDRALSAASRGELGLRSLEALRRAGWITEPPLPLPDGAESVPELLALALKSLDEWWTVTEQRQLVTATARTRLRSAYSAARVVFVLCIGAIALLLVLAGADVFKSSVAAAVSAVVGALASLIAAQRWTELAQRETRLALTAHRLIELQLEINEARWRIAADRRPESVELTMSRLRRDYEHAMWEGGLAPSPTAAEL